MSISEFRKFEKSHTKLRNTNVGKLWCFTENSITLDGRSCYSPQVTSADTTRSPQNMNSSSVDAKGFKLLEVEP